MDKAITYGVNSVFLLCSFGTLPQYVFSPFVYHKVNFQRPNHFFPHKMFCISFKAASVKRAQQRAVGSSYLPFYTDLE